MIVGSHIIITITILIVIVSLITVYKSSKTMFYYTDIILDKIFSKIFTQKNKPHYTNRDTIYDEVFSREENTVDNTINNSDYIVNTYYDNPAYNPNDTVPEYRRDPQRVFKQKDIDDALYRAHYQCEHVDKNGVRCVSHLELQADHHYPHSRGGATRYDPTQELNIFENNLVILCGKHNRMKTNRHPSREETMRIEEMRYQTHYYH